MKSFNRKLFITLAISSFALFASALLCSCNMIGDELIILYTNDVHGHFGEVNHLSYSNIAQMKKNIKNTGRNVLLMDAGDHLSGSLNAVYDHGETVKDLMGMAGYDVACLGNHEFDAGFERLDEVIESASYDYICTNLYHAESDVPTTRYIEPTKVFTFPNYKIGVVGILTPETLSDATPEFFKDYYFKAGDELYSEVQGQVDSLKEEGCDVVIALAHLGMEEEDDENPSSSKSVIENTNHIDALIDGHTHFYMPKRIVKNKDGKDVIISQTGSYFENIGMLTVKKQNNSYSVDTSMVNRYPEFDTATYKVERDYINKIEEEFGKKIASTENDFYKSSCGEDTNLADLCADAFYYCANNNDETKNIGADFAFVNRGGIRDYILPGDITIKKCREIFSFDNSFVIAEVTGTMLWQGLEYAMRNYPEYAGGALIPAGLRCDVDCSKHAEFTFDSAGGWVSGPNTSEHRVDNIQMFDFTNNKWVDVEISDTATYKVAGSNFIFDSGGDGLNMFGPKHEKHEVLYKSNDYYDYMCLVDYMSAFTEGDDGYPDIKTSNSPLDAYSNYLIDYEHKKPTELRYNFLNVGPSR